MKIYQTLETQLKREPNFVTDNGELKKWVVISKAQNFDAELLALIMGHEELKAKFFVQVNDAWVFNQNLFVQFLEQKNYLNDSYTQYKNKVGLNVDGKYLKQRNEVALVWPFKDCILEGGQSREEDKREEIFFNEILAQDEITQLLEPKVFSNSKRIDADGEHSLDIFNRNEHGTITDNLIIKGNNLLALHSLQEEFAGKVKLIYIDPPYNTGKDSFKYNDSFNHSTWLTFMKNRLKVAKKFMRLDGVIFVQCDDNEQAYLKVLMDEIFGDDNFINTISVNMKNVAGASGGGEDIKLKKNIEYIHIYTKDYKSLKPFTDAYDYVPLIEMVEQYRLNDVSWKYTSVLFDSGDKEYVATTYDGGGDEIKIFKRNNAVFKSINKIMSDEGISESDAYNKYAHLIHQTAMPQSSIRPRVMEKLSELDIDGELFSIEYVPRSGKNKGVIYEQYYKGDSFRLLAWLKDVSEVIDGVLCKKERQGTYWNFAGETKNLTKEGCVELLSGKKPEKLLQRIIDMSTNKDDMVLDFHLGSGTTAAVAHKMGRQYIGIEQMDYGQNDSFNRLQNVINGDSTGISKSVNWQGGGSFVYMEMKKYNQSFIELIEDAKDSDALLKVWEQMKEKSFLNYNVDIQKQEAHIEEFKALNLDEQKRHLCELLDKNQLYINRSSLDDQDFACTDAEKTVTRNFYSKGFQ